MVAIRPLIPNIKASEIDKIIESTHPYVFGYYTGPLYLKNLDNGIINQVDIDNPDILITETQPAWMPQNSTFLKVENPKLMIYLKDIVEKRGKILFDGAAQGIKYLRNRQL